MSAQSACDACLRRSWLLSRLAGHIEVARRASSALPELLALPDDGLVAAVAAKGAGRVTAERARFDADRAREDVAAAGLTATCRHDAGFPPQLRDGPDTPAALFAAGDAALLGRLADPGERAVAIVGTRRASSDALQVARALGRDLALAGVPVISGMALGVDSAAQRGALDGGGLSVAVLGRGPERAYPPSKARLHADLVAGGLVVAELPPGTPPRRWTFPARNRIIAGLADLTVVVEAAERSGSLITAELAMKLGRDVAAVPGPVTSPRAVGTNGLLHDGAALVRDARDVLDALYGAGGGPPPRRRTDGLEPHLAALLDAVAGGLDSVEALAGPSPGATTAALVGLTELELRGLVERRPGGRYGVVL